MSEGRADEIKRELMAVIDSQRTGRPTPEVKAWLDTLDAAGLNAALYLMAELKINPVVMPKLLPLIDRERTEVVLEFQICELLEKLESEM
jgi:hypothetical protein